MDGHITVPIWLVVASMPFAAGLLVWTWRYARRATPGQINHDRILLETLEAQERRVALLQTQVDSLESQVTRLREDLHWEREQNRKLRREISFLRVGDHASAAVSAIADEVVTNLNEDLSSE
jgi:predicted  nucleic acid-binding Zn-ribbon protein